MNLPHTLVLPLFGHCFTTRYTPRLSRLDDTGPKLWLLFRTRRAYPTHHHIGVSNDKMPLFLLHTYILQPRQQPSPLRWRIILSIL